MATCNGARFVDVQLASLASQTRRPDELVVCDDASQDDTLARVRAFAANAPFEVRASPNAERLGTTRNFERAVAACTGDVVFFADQDDVWLPAKVERMCAALDTRPEVGAVLCNGSVVDAAGASLGYDLWRALDFDAGEQRAVASGSAHEVFARHVVAAGTTFAFRRRYAELALPFPDLRSAHDAWVAFLVASVSEIALIAEPLIHYRLHGDNQLGLRRMGFREQLEAARRQLELGAFDYAARFFEAAGERLRSAAAAPFALRPGVLETVDAKAHHSRVRDAMPASLAARIPIVLGELRRGHYRRYAYGWKSVAQDLALRRA